MLQIHLFQALQQASHEVYQLGLSFFDRGDDALALVAFDAALSQLSILCFSSLLEMDQLLKQFGTYIKLVASIISDAEPLATQQARRAFGVTELSDHSFTVRQGTFLHDGSKSNRFLRVDLTIRLKERLRTRLCHKVTEGTELCSRNPQLSAVCLPFLVDGTCRDSDCKQGHILKSSENPGQYNAHISICLRQVWILYLMRTMYPQDVWNER